MTHDNFRGRRATGYSMAQHGGAGAGGGLTGNHVLKSTANANLYSPSWNNTLTTFRPFPVPDPDSPNGLSPYRRSAEDTDFGSWFVCYPYFKGGANNLISFLAWDPVANPEYDASNNPVSVLYHGIKAAIRLQQERPGWGALLLGTDGRGAPLTDIDQLFLMQGALLQHKNVVFPVPKGGGKDDKLLVLSVTGGAGRALRDMLNERAPGWTGSDEDYERSFLYGDPVNPQGGRLFRFCQTKGQLSPPSAALAGPGYGAAAAGQQTQQMEKKGFDVQIVNGAPGMFPPPVPEELIRSKVRLWEDLLFFPGHEEQVVLLARQFPASAIEYAYRDRPEWLTPEVRAILAARAQASVPGPVEGYPPAGGYHQPAGSQHPAPQGYGASASQGYYGVSATPVAQGYGALAQPGGQPGYPPSGNSAAFAATALQQPVAGNPVPQGYGATQPLQPSQAAQAAPGWGAVAFENRPVPGIASVLDPALRPSMLPAGNAAPSQSQAAPFDGGMTPPSQPLDPRLAALRTAQAAVAAASGSPAG